MSKIDRASDVEFVEAIAAALPQPGKKDHLLLKMGLAYLAGKAIENAAKKR